MPRFAAVFAISLMLVTGIVIGQVANLGLPASSQPVVVYSADPSAVDEFYAAINALLETGNPAALRTIVDPAYVEHRPASDGIRDLHNLEQELLAMRSAFSGLRMKATTISGENQLFALSVHFSGEMEIPLAGLEIVPAFPSEQFEVVRVENRKVVERWTNSPVTASFTPVIQAARIDPSPRVRQPVLERVTLQPGASFEFQSSDAGMLVSESSTLLLRAPDAGGGAWALEPGQSQMLEADIAVHAWNAGRLPASFVLLHIRPLSNSTLPGLSTSTLAGPSTRGESADVSRETLTRAINILPLDRAYQLQVGFATAPAGTLVTKHQVAGAEMLFVTGGGVSAQVSAGEIWVRIADDTFKAAQESLMVPGGHAISAEAGTELSYEVISSEPATFLLITVREVE